MRKTIVLLALMAGACSQQPENSGNAAEANAEAGAGSDVPILGNEGQAPSAPIGNDQMPVPPGDNEAVPPPAPSGNVTLTAAPTQTSAGSAVTLTLANGSRQTVGYNLCTSALQTAAGAEVRTDRVCTLELRTLEPGRNATYRYELPGRLSDGRYRFSTGLDQMPSGGPTSVTSNTIEVR